MKSSRSVISSEGQSARVCAWLPDEIDDRPAPAREPEVRALIDIFRPESPSPARTTVGRGAPQPWEPADFGQLAEVTCADQEKIIYFPLAAAQSDKGADFSSQNGGGRRIEAARQEAEVILAAARQQAEQIRCEAELAAAEEFERARAEGYAAGRAELEEQINAVKAVFEQTNAWREELFAASEPIILQLVKSIAVALFGQGVALSDSALQQNLNRIVEQAKSLGDLKIYLNPADAATLDPDWREFQSTITGNRVQVISSESITRGGAFVQGQMGTVDARVETQLKAVLDALAGPTEGNA